MIHTYQLVLSDVETDDVQVLSLVEATRAPLPPLNQPFASLSAEGKAAVRLLFAELAPVARAAYDASLTEVGALPDTLVQLATAKQQAAEAVARKDTAEADRLVCEVAAAAAKAEEVRANLAVAKAREELAEIQAAMGVALGGGGK